MLKTNVCSVVKFSHAICRVLSELLYADATKNALNANVECRVCIRYGVCMAKNSAAVFDLFVFKSADLI